MSFQVPATTTAANTAGFSFGLSTAPAGGASKPTSFTFGGAGSGDAGVFLPPPQATATIAPIASTTTAAAAAAAAAAPATATTSSFSFGAPTAAATSVAAAAVSAPAAQVTKSTAAPTLGLGTATSVAAPTSTAGGFANLSTATKTTPSSAVVTASQVSYNQLEEHINKWTLELEEQEKIFTDQATQINAWDKILIGNNQKILELNDAVQKVKSDQQTLEQELEFIATQHRELEESITPLQKEFLHIPQVDVERSQTYLMVENLDTQLKQMSEDLKEIIDNLNDSNKVQENTDPIMQIGKILNAHMSSLQWIESSSANICNKLDEITKMHENFKRDSERSFRSAYYN